MRKLILGSGLSLVVLGGAVASQAQTDTEAEKSTDEAVKIVDDQATKSTATPYLKLGDIKGESTDRSSSGYLKLGDIKGEARDASDGYLKLGDIKGEARDSSNSFLKLGDIEGESQRSPDHKVEIDMGVDKPLAPSTKAGEPTLKNQERSPDFKIEIDGVDTASKIKVDGLEGQAQENQKPKK
ncbi:MAG: hypothetical protein HKN36_12640 [Hellea sp.]|nr:hypothetical protein [Hellea sp.]